MQALWLTALCCATAGVAFAGVGADAPNRAGAAQKARKKPRHADAAADRALVKALAPKLSVRSAKSALSAVTAVSATTAGSASTAASATNAANADALQGHPASSFLGSDRLLSSGIIAPTVSNTGVMTHLLTTGPIELSARCDIIGGDARTATVYASSTDPNSFASAGTASMPINSTPSAIYTIGGSTTPVLHGSLPAAIVTQTAAVHVFVTIGVHVGGPDCVAGVIAAP